MSDLPNLELGEGIGTLIAQEMRQGRQQLQQHLKGCRLCTEFAALCPDAVKLFIKWRGKPPRFDHVLGGAAWVDGHPPDLDPGLKQEQAPGDSWRLIRGKRPLPLPDGPAKGFLLVRALDHEFGQGKVHYLADHKNIDGLYPTLCGRVVAGYELTGRNDAVTCKHCRRMVETSRNRPLRGEQLSLGV